MSMTCTVTVVMRLGGYGVPARQITLRCGSCGMSWDVPPKPDGTMPIGSRCPKDRGGCGKVRKLPAAARRGSLPGAAGEWDPPSAPRQPCSDAGPCPECGAPLAASPRGTVRVCRACVRIIAPPGVLAPYERGETAARQVRSQRERDLESIGLAGHKGAMLARLRALAGNERLGPAELPKIEWFAEQVRAAASGSRLAELAALFAEACIKPRGWWQWRPVLAAVSGDGDGYADYDGEDQDGEPAAPVVLATPDSIARQQRRAQRRALTWDDAITASGWRLDPAAGAGCPVVSTRGQVCGSDTRQRIGNRRVCGRHYEQLAAVIARISREQREA